VLLPAAARHRLRAAALCNKQTYYGTRNAAQTCSLVVKMTTLLPPALSPCLPATAGLQLRRLYRSQLILGSIDTGLLLGLALWFAWSTRSARLEHRVWNLRQTYFSRTAGALLCLQLLHSVIYVTALGIVLDQEGCAFPWAAVAALEFVRVRYALLGWGWAGVCSPVLR
jgi:hypothetical protein